MITDEMVEAAGQAVARYGGMGDLGPSRLDRNLARVALEAVEPLIRQQTAEAIAAACERAEDHARRGEEIEGIVGNKTFAASWQNIATGYMRSAEIAREYGKGDPNG